MRVKRWYDVYVIVTEQKNTGSAASHHKSQTCETDTGAKGKGFYSSAAQPGRMVDSCLKAHLFFLPWKVQLSSARPRQKPVSRIPAPF